MESDWRDRPWGLVLSGGGAKGVYEIGVWKALVALGIQVNAVVGTSAGAINACAYAQGDLPRIEDAWLSMRLSDIAVMPVELVRELEKAGSGPDPVALLRHRQALFPKGGIDTAPLRATLGRMLDEKSVRNSGLDVGIITYELSSLRPVEIFLEGIPEGTLLDYVMASAAMPIFKRPRIGSREYVDGAVFDNIPVRTLRERGYRRIIVVDVSGIGVSREVDGAGSITAYVRNSMQMGHILNFEESFLRDYMELGRLDTLRVFGEFEGTDYFLQPAPALTARLEGVLADDAAVASLAPLIGHKSFSESPSDLRKAIRYLLPKRFAGGRNLMICLAECAASALGVQRNRVYNLPEFLDAIRTVHAASGKKGPGFLDSEFRSFLDRISASLAAVLPKKFEKRTPFENYRALFPLTFGKTRHPLYGFLEAIHPELTAALAFLALLDRLPPG
jgi:NTE family protein